MEASAEQLVPMLAFCEAPFDGTLDGTSALSPSPARGSAAASKPSSPGDAVVSRDAQLMAIAKELAKPSSQRRGQAQQQQEKAEAVDDLAIFETVVLHLQ